MNRVLQLEKELLSPPETRPVPGFHLRTFTGQADLPGWLALRQAAFAREKLGVRAWEATDFRQEFLDKPWWQAQHCWIVEEATQLRRQDSTSPLAGSVTLAMRTHGSSSQPVVHWLMVHPRFRQAGLARWLLATLEHQAWQLGYRRICLETHSAWESAARFYQAAGYATSLPKT